jgi:hypothetical protein
MRIASPGHAAFAATMVALGVWGLVRGVLPPNSQTGTLVAGAWVLYAWLGAARLSGGPEARRAAFAGGDRGVRIGQVFYGLAQLVFGEAHFRYLALTAGLVPSWLPAHTFWATFTGCTFVAAGLAVLTGFQARLAAALSALQLALFTLLVWVPMMAHGPSAFQWSELVVSWAVTVGAWVVADSYRTRELAT